MIEDTYKHFERWQKNIDLALVLLVCKCKQVVREVKPLHIGVALDQIEYLSAADHLIRRITLILVLLVIQLEQVIDLCMCLLFPLLRHGALF